MVQKVKGLISRTGESIKGFSSDPINNLGFLIPMAICLTSIVTGIVTYIMFIVNGGYSSQVGSIKENGLDGISEGFTSGTTGMMVPGIVGKILLALVVAELIVMLINYFKNRGKGMRIAMIVDLVVMGVVIALSTVVFRIAVGELVFSEEQLYQALGKFEGVTINLRAILIAYVAVTLVSVICFIVFTLITAECRWMVGYTALSLVFANIVMPLFFLILQNIIPLVSGAVALVVIGALIFFGIKIVASSGGEGGSSPSSSDSSSSGGSWSSSHNEKKVNTGNLSERGEKKRANKELVIEETCAYVPYFNRTLGFKLWKVHGMMHDYIASDNGMITREICSLEWFEKGKFHIYESESGRKIKSSEIPWMKQN